MSIEVSSNQITSDSGKIFFKEGDKSIEVRENQVFITDKFISCGSYIFTKGLALPLARICIDARETPNSTVIFDFATLTMMDGEGNPSTFSQVVSYVPKDNISAVLLDSSINRAYQISVARSGIGNTNAELAQNEITHFVESGGFDVSYYNKDNSAPQVSPSQILRKSQYFRH